MAAVFYPSEVTMRIRKMFLFVILVATVALPAASAETKPDQFDVIQYGAKPDGTSDATAAFQQALDAAWWWPHVATTCFAGI
jgi:hypothetical protein